MALSKEEQHFRSVAPTFMRRLLGDFPVLGELDLAAVFGNAGHESRGLTDDQEDKPTVKGSRGGANWMQWTGPRRRQLEAFAAEHKLDPNGDEAAYRFLVHELRGAEKKAIGALTRAKTLSGKVQAFEKAFLRAGIKHYPGRLRWAEIALDAYKKAGGTTEADADVPIAFPVKGARDDEVVAQVQRRLKELGYTEIGNVDGDFGDMTEKAILIFRHDNGLPLTSDIDEALLVAMAKAAPRKLPEARTEATPADVREKVPEARDTWWSKVLALWGTIGAILTAVVQFTISSFSDAKALVKPIVDVFGNVPAWGWAVLIAGGLLTIWLKSRSSEQKAVVAYQEGARR